MPKPNTLYERVLRATEPYLGPASQRFIDRQIQNHLQKDPADLNSKDLIKLIDWIHIAVSFLSEDAELIETYISELRQLIDLSSHHKGTF